jgi:hypothetical protein
MITDQQVEETIVKALTPHVGTPLTPDNVRKLKAVAVEALRSIERTAPPGNGLSEDQVVEVVDASFDRLLRVVAEDMAEEAGANAPGGES